jgi:hypothetical protein
MKICVINLINKIADISVNVRIRRFRELITASLPHCNIRLTRHWAPTTIHSMANVQLRSNSNVMGLSTHASAA